MKLRILLMIMVLFPAFSNADGQKKERKQFVSGTVTDTNGNPVEGVEIFIDNEGTGKLTDNLGKFNFRTKPEAKRIFVYSAEHGYCEAEIIRESPMNLNLKKLTGPPPEFIAKNSRNKQTAPAVAKKMNTYTDIYQMIRHEVSGVVVSGRSVVVQGPNSFFGSSQPLFVVNGVRVSNIDYINPVEVKSIRLLKGSNANIYGTEGANGVIVIDLEGSGNRSQAGKDERVNIGYGSIERKDLTTPVNSVDFRNSRYAAYPNIYEVLKGAVPGVHVSGNKITIQGITSINLSNDPLFIVDGMEATSIDYIQPVQVESIEVLKGASASIYGSRGANGVILIKLIGADTRR